MNEPRILQASKFRLKDVGFEIHEALRAFETEFWEPLERLADRYFQETGRDILLAELLRQWGPNAKGRQYDAVRLALDKSVNQEAVSPWLKAQEDASKGQLDLPNSAPDHMVEYLKEEILWGDSGRDAYGRWVPDAIEWIGLAVASGVTGNLAYDVLKRGWGTAWTILAKRLLRRSDALEVAPDEALAYLVKIAVREQCRKLNFPVPAVASLNIVDWLPGEKSVAARLKSTYPELQAIVEVPYLNLENAGVRVSISLPDGQ